jgi:hypothetical protein
MTAMSITPDTKDWTWVLERPCAECGFEAAAHDVSALPDLLEATASSWTQVLGRDEVAERPRPGVWSALEYGCHVRDVHVLFAERVRLMLAEDTPTFASWDQDVTAVERDYGSQDAPTVAAELVAAARAAAALYASVTDATRGRRGLRSNGDEFTVETLGRYHLHDVVHHLHDVGAPP